MSALDRFTDDSRKVRFAQTHKTIRATGDDSRNSMDVSRKQAAISFKLRFN